ncbi:MAG: flagellar basal body rod protein FlgB [Pseudolabrys sp.]
MLAENVANADTPNYRSRDLARLKFETSTPLTTVALMRTENGHIAGFGQSDTPFKFQSENNDAVRPTGNAVNLEQEMMKVAANQMDYQAVSALYTRSLSLLKLALGKGGTS